MYHISFQELLLSVILELNNERVGFGKTRLIKLLYLIEVEHYRLYKEHMTEKKWVYYKYGPYIMDFDECLVDSNIRVEINDGNFTKIEVVDNSEVPSLPAAINGNIKNIISEFSKKDLRDLLDYVYYETEPMMNVNQRGEQLDFSHILPNSYYEVKEFRNLDAIKKRLRKKYKKICQQIKV